MANHGVTHKIDPRIVRTRRALLEAFTSLLAEKHNIRHISIQAIAERAGVNRVTFYAHFTDKDDLLSEWKRGVFRGLLAERLEAGQDVKDLAFSELIDVILDFIASYNKYFSVINKEYMPLFSAALQQEFVNVVAEMLTTRLTVKANTIPTTATFLGWAIYGSANELSSQQTTKEVAAKQILTLIDQIIT